jgi:uncharacterized protein YoxC
MLANVTSSFKTKLRDPGRQTDSYLTFDTTTIDSSQIQNIKPYYNGQLFKSVMRCLEFEYKGALDLSDLYLSYFFGVKIPTDINYEYIKLGDYKVIPNLIENIIERNSKKLTCYDKMVQSMIPYDLYIEDWSSMTAGLLLQAICDRLGWVLETTTFTNSNLPITEDLFSNTDAKFRDVLDVIAGMVGGCLFFSNGQLVVRNPALIANEVIGPNGIEKMAFGDKFGPINSIILSILEADNGTTTGDVYKKDEDSIALNGLTEIKISGNAILNQDRGTSIVPLFNALNGLIMYPVELTSWGFLIYEPCDIVLARDTEGNEKPILILESEVTITTGLKEKIYSTITKKAVTNYQYADPYTAQINRAMINIKNAEAKIESITQTTENNTNKISSMEQDVTGFKHTVEETYETINESNSKNSELQQSVNSLGFNLSGTGGINDKKNSSAQFGIKYHTVVNVQAVEDNNVSSGYAFQHHDVSSNISDKFTPRKTKILSNGQYVDSNDYFISWNVKNELEFGKVKVTVNQYLDDVIIQTDSMIVDKNTAYEIKSLLVSLVSNVMNTIEETIGEDLTYDQASEPVSPKLNETWHSTTTDIISKWDGSAWVNTNLNYSTDVADGIILPKGYAMIAENMCAGGSIYRNWQSAPGEFKGRDFQWDEEGQTISDGEKSINLDVGGIHAWNGFEETLKLTPDDSYSKKFRGQVFTNENITIQKVAGGTGFYYVGGGS